MKNLFYTGIVSALLLIGLNGCYKTCEDAFAPNYTLKGGCLDLTDSITGTYTGQLMDSIVGQPGSTISNVSIQVTKVDDSHVALASSNTSSFVHYNAALTDLDSYTAPVTGLILTIPSQSSNGLTVTGAGSYFNPILGGDGNYTVSNRQLMVYSLAGTQYQVFTGTRQ